MKFRVICADPPFSFSDQLTMNDVKRGAESNYSVLSIDDIKNLDVKKLAAKDSVLALWCPSSIIPDGLEIMKAWGFDFKQTWIWVKTKKNPMIIPIKQFAKWKRAKLKKTMAQIRKTPDLSLDDFVTEFNLNEVLAFGLGRLFRQTHEVCLIGTRGKIYSKLKNKSQRSVFFHSATDHSEKPEGLQDMLDIMFSGSKLEMFARRQRKNWICVGNEAPMTMNEDIRDSIEYLSTNKKQKIVQKLGK